jgi:hypothetical protein
LDVAARGGNFVVAVVGGLSGRRENRQPIFGHKSNHQISVQKNARKARGHRQNTAATAQKKKKTLLRQQLAIPHHTVVRSG